ncbi:MAG: twin-arginine translocation signal domain-containing protein [Deltaproteobacteria bacterium]|nr:twin-arginine translocation signal domain-containing protein [Deltaproteobacteria bacterium]
MDINRRDFLKITGTSAAGAAILGLGLNLKPIKSHAQSLKINHCKETTSICCYCAVGCGVICSTGRAGAGKIVNIEGDPDHPVNEGALCAKGAGLSQLANNDRRITAPLYRAPYSNRWRKVSWEWALSNIAKRVKKSRDASFEHKNNKGQVVNRTLSIASVGSAALDNEECWLIQALMRSLGLVYIEHQARI